MADSKDKFLGKILDNRYEILEVIGTGGMAVVYKALCHRLNRHVAVKMLKEDLALDADFRRRFQTESKAVAMLSHPNIVSVYDVSRSRDLEYIVMELIEGITLKQYMQKKGALTWKEALHFSTQIAKALSHAHSRGIIHRDIKPHNIMIVKDGSIKVADFGIARLPTSQHTVAQEALGSVHYISPEQAKGEAVDMRSDIYSAGVVMYEMLTGELPFDGDTAVSVAIQHISSVPVLPREIDPEIPEGFEIITMNAMNPNLETRYPSADVLLEDLEEFRKNQNAQASNSNTMPFVPVTTGENSLTEPRGRGQYIIEENVLPVSTSGELKRESYERRRIRANKVSLLSGISCVLIFILALSIFLWNFWLKWLFQESEPVNIPNFIGSNVSDLMGDKEYEKIFSFTVVTQVDPTHKMGTVISQRPEAGRTQMLGPDGIGVVLTIASGEITVTMPDVVNWEYNRAVAELERLGFVVERETVASNSITKDYIVETIPAADEKLPGGSTVYISVSGGPKIVPVIMPNLVGMTQAAAIAHIESLRLVVGTISPVESEQKEGTIIWQSITADEEITEHTKIFLQVAVKPRETETPEPSESPSPTPGTPSPTPTQAPPSTTPPETPPPATVEPAPVTPEPTLEPPPPPPPEEENGNGEE